MPLETLWHLMMSLVFCSMSECFLAIIIKSVCTHPSVWTRGWPAPARRRPGHPGHSSCSAGWEEAGCCSPSPACCWKGCLSTQSASTWNKHKERLSCGLETCFNTFKNVAPDVEPQVVLQNDWQRKADKSHYLTCWRVINPAVDWQIH